ncbi:MAG: hypothetical protein ACTSUB_01365, partial [Candidatus Thorarchaeota archaeon]
VSVSSLDMDPDFNDTIEISYDSTLGLVGTISGGDGGQILSPAQWTAEGSRVATYVGIQWRKGSGIYLDHRVHDILLNDGIPTTTTVTPTDSNDWHDSCDSISGWSYHTLWDGWTRWETATGTLESDNGYLHCPENSGWETGPFWFKELSQTFTLTQFESFTSLIETIQPTQTYKGNFRITIFDSAKNPIFYIGINSWHELEHYADIHVGYYFENLTAASYSSTEMVPDFDDTIEIEVNSLGELIGRIPGGADGGSETILSATDWAEESDRIAQYVGIQWRRGSGTYLDHRLYDIAIEISDPSTTDAPPVFDFGGILGIGITVGSVAIIIIIGGAIFCKRQGATSTSEYYY